ncbi:MAG: aldehyde ferredoxin oxidoreductase family protein [Thermodesulfobacteriota bacterium]
MPGWMGQILRVDLSRGHIQEEELDRKAARDFIGGRGLGIHYLLKEQDPKLDAFSPDNRLIMATGPLTGTKAPTGARYMVMTKSPLTGALTCSNAGGRFPAMFKWAGFDAIIFQGRSPEPVYLWVEDGRAELRPAGRLWGKNSKETDEAVRAETNEKAKVASIGPAGERGVLFAAIMSDQHRAAGRSGVGAVMGSKNLKAVAVYGRRQVPLADAEGFNAYCREQLEIFKAATKANPPAIRKHGTAYVVMVTNNYGVLPTRNWQQGTFESWPLIHGEKLTSDFLVRNSACHSCPIACGRVTRVTLPGFEGEGEGPEYETIYALGSNCGVDNLAAVTKANYLCNELGLDTITMGATLACAMELAERGYLPPQDLGRPLKFGDAEALVEFTRLTGLNEGFGRKLGLGSKRLAEMYGHPELAIHSKGQEPAGYEPRGEQGMGLAYATSPIGASHMRGDPAYVELFGTPVRLDPHTWQDKPELVARWQHVSALTDSAGLCIFFAARQLLEPTLKLRPEGIRRLLNSATGADYSLEELEKAGERIFNAERLWLNRAGFNRKDDTLPDRLTKEPAPTGPAQGQVCHLDEMLEPYYRFRGWNQNGEPTLEKLQELGVA